MKKIMLYTMESLEFSGFIITDGTNWEYREVSNPHLIDTTRGMPLAAVLPNLACFGLVYDIIE